MTGARAGLLVIALLVASPGSSVAAGPALAPVSPDARLPDPDSLRVGPYDCARIREQIVRGDAWVLHPDDYKQVNLDHYGISSMSTLLAGCRAMQSGSEAHCFTGFPVHDRFCMQMVVSTGLIAAHARGEDCAALARRYGNRAGIAQASWEALCKGMDGDADACQLLQSDNRKNTFNVECDAIRLDDPGHCGKCVHESPCGRNCAGFVALHRAIRDGKPRDPGRVADGLPGLARSVNLDPGFDCDAWFRRRFDQLCTD